MPLATLLIALVVASCGLAAFALTRFAGVDGLDGYLATTPGGLYAVLAMAVDSQVDVAFVLAAQILRVVALLILAPWVAGRLLDGDPGVES